MEGPCTDEIAFATAASRELGAERSECGVMDCAAGSIDEEKQTKW